MSATALRPPPTPARSRARGRSPGIGWVFTFPALLVFGLFVAYPLVRSFYLALTSQSEFGSSQFSGLHNYRVMLHDPILQQALKVTLIYTIVATLLQTIVPLVIALLLNVGAPGTRIFSTLFFIPSVISLTISGTLWRLALASNYGLVNRLLDGAGLGSLTRTWLGDSATVLPSIIAISLWQSFGLYMLIMYAGLKGVDPAIGESARVDGAGRLREAWSITIPTIRPVIDVVILLNVINGLKVFDLPFVMTGGGPLHESETLSTYTYSLTFGSNNGGVPALGYGAAVSTLVFVIAAVATILLRRFRKTAP